MSYTGLCEIAKLPTKNPRARPWREPQHQQASPLESTLVLVRRLPDLVLGPRHGRSRGNDGDGGDWGRMERDEMVK